MSNEKFKGEIEREEERRQAIIDLWGDQPPVLGAGETFPMATGSVLVLDGSHTVVRNGRSYYIGIDKEQGWVQTGIEVGTMLGG